MRHPTATCPRCGITRRVDRARKTGICASCRVRIPEPTAADALPPGEWVNRGGIRVFVPSLPPIQYATPCHCGDYYQGTCETCMRWAERDAERAEWARESRANRGRIWAILDQRKEAAA